MDDLAGAVAAHFAAIGNDEVRAGEIHGENAVLEYVQSGERICGKSNVIAARRAYPGGRPPSISIARWVRMTFRSLSSRFASLGTIVILVVAILEFRDGKVVRERIYIAEPWEPPPNRAQRVEPNRSWPSERGQRG